MKKSLRSRLFVSFVILSFRLICVFSLNKENNITRQRIRDAGCPFRTEEQLIEQAACLMPEYASNESPKNEHDAATNISIYLLHASVLELNEMKNTLTLELLQYLDWSDSRIKANFSESKQSKMKLSVRSVHRIWKPELDIYTKDVKEWKSMFHPALYQEIYLSKDGANPSSNTKLSALKSWKATIFCRFDFAQFPFDTQHCAFLQFGSSQDIHLISSCRKISWTPKYKVTGFDYSLQPVGPFCETSSPKPQTLWMDTGFNITLKRQINPYLYQYYFPSLAIVVVSQISFIIPLSSVPGRVGLVVTQFLTLTNIFIHQMVRMSLFLCTTIVIILLPLW